jgi:hypothetical protein
MRYVAYRANVIGSRLFEGMIWYRRVAVGMGNFLDFEQSGRVWRQAWDSPQLAGGNAALEALGEPLAKIPWTCPSRSSSPQSINVIEIAFANQSTSLRAHVEEP